MKSGGGRNASCGRPFAFAEGSRVTRVLVTIALLLAASAGHAAQLLHATWSQNIQGLDVTVTGRNTDGDPEFDIGSGSCSHDFPNPYVQVSITCPDGLIGSSGS